MKHEACCAKIQDAYHQRCCIRRGKNGAPGRMLCSVHTKQLEKWKAEGREVRMAKFWWGIDLTTPAVKL